MASPTVVGTPTESNATADDATPYTISRPSGVSGQLTIVFLSVDGNPTLTWPSGYTSIADIADNVAQTKRAVAYHQEDGTEGTTFDVTSSASEKWAAVVYSISGGENPSTQAPEATTASAATGSIDPASITPTGGSKDYLFLCGGGINGEFADDDTWATAAPTNYSNLRVKTTAITGATTTNTTLATAERALTASTDNPGTFTQASTSNWSAVTVAVHPAAPVTPSAAAVGRVHVRATATQLKIGIASAAARAHIRATATGFAIKAVPASGRIHVRATATGAAVTAVQSAPAVGRVHLRATATGFAIKTASAVGRLHVRGTASGAEVTPTPNAPAVGRIHLRATATGFAIKAASAVGRIHLRGTAQALSIQHAAAVGRLHVRARAAGIAGGGAGPVEDPKAIWTVGPGKAVGVGPFVVGGYAGGYEENYGFTGGGGRAIDTATVGKARDLVEV